MVFNGSSCDGNHVDAGELLWQTEVWFSAVAVYFLHSSLLVSAPGFNIPSLICYLVENARMPKVFIPIVPFQDF